MSLCVTEQGGLKFIARSTYVCTYVGNMQHTGL